MLQHHEIDEQTHINVIQAFNAAGAVQERMASTTLVVLSLSGDSHFATLGGRCTEAEIAALEELLENLKARAKEDDQFIEIGNFTL
ncbi:hypothetical protein [uncultured Pseudomonas sp.]|uniref:hypothetical protein n=1 Tax=uncultured Pseudomonas sp. TaxID=114707 RepID=UPI0025F86E1F|nr:hypothetical protein [uncultured Pseudomonas sp.]